MAAHTPGPWETGNGAGEVVLAAKRNGARQRIATFYIANDSAESFANASLVAAAPELLAALKAVQSQCAGHCDEFSGNVWRIADAAIARAEGR
jgi:hypothetical protein